MRTNTLVGTEEVVAIVLEDVAKQLSFSITKIKASIEAGGFGVHKNISRDFLLPTSDTTNILRGKTAIKRKCCAVKLSSLPKDMQLQLKSGKLTITFLILPIHIFSSTMLAVTNQSVPKETDEEGTNTSGIEI